MASYICTNCGNTTTKWSGQCPNCKEWNTVEENKSAPAVKAGGGSSFGGNGKASVRAARAATGNAPRSLRDIKSDEYTRIKSNIQELDRVLGGGFVPGGVILLAGSPGAGKSSLTTEIAKTLTSKDDTVLIISGEETESQIAARANRLGVTSDKLLLLSENNLTNALSHAEAIHPDLLIVDSLQTLVSDSSESRTGSVTQVAEVATETVKLAKSMNIPTILIGHVTKSGEIGGPRTVEHLVDVVLYLEASEDTPLRLLRGVKNRYGATDEIGVFQHTETGLEQVTDPSGFFMQKHEPGTVGYANSLILEGNRVLPAEFAALVTDTVLPNPRKITHGLEHSRVVMIQAIVEKHTGTRLADRDVYVSTAGGVNVKDSSIDLAVAAALMSSAGNIAIPEGTIFLGETSLTGEVRPARSMAKRVKEAERLGFTTIVSSEPSSAKNRKQVKSTYELAVYLRQFKTKD